MSRSERHMLKHRQQVNALMKQEESQQNMAVQREEGRYMVKLEQWAGLAGHGKEF